MARTGLRPITWAAIAGVVVTLGMLALILASALRSFEYTCEACMTFRGQTLCREAVGTTADEATQTAIDNACALLGARGMSLSIECTNTPPASVTCNKGGQ